MSFVGPRPVTGEELECRYRENAESYCLVKPGITGLWQVSGRSERDYGVRVRLDLWYIRNWSLWLDLVILVRTLGVVFRKRGAC
jgi:lipopolysaccharide/colanic/teichoic acid biosynthesis glycosyltransferase